MDATGARDALTLELFFVAASFVVGVGQIVDAAVLVRRDEPAGAVAIYFSLFETLWAIFCVYLLARGQLAGARWLAIMYLAYFPIAMVVGFMANPNAMNQPFESIRLPKSSAYLAWAFGAVYSLSALWVLARA